MTLLYMAWRNLVNRRVQTLITVVVVSVGVAMALSIMMISGGLKQGIIKASEPFGMIVGSKGSANQLVFNTIFLMDKPLSNITLDYYKTLENDPRVAQAVPFALGDNYQGFRLVGTSSEFFSLKAKPADPPYFQLAEGRLFEEPFEAVIGAKVARETGLKIGDQFTSGHGVLQALEDDEEHKDNPYTVVGILRSVVAPSDQGIYVQMESYWISHHQHEEAPGETPDHKPANEINSEHDENGDHDEHGDHDEQADHADDSPGVTAALIKPISYMDLMKMYQEINSSESAQAVFPGQVIAKIFDMMGSGEQILKNISYVVLAMTGLTIVLALYGSTLERRRTVSILRAIGAGRHTVVMIVLLESLLVVILGCIAGAVAGYGLSTFLSAYIGSQSSITVSLVYDWNQLTLLGAVAVMGIVAGILPAASAYRTEAARYLNTI